MKPVSIRDVILAEAKVLSAKRLTANTRLDVPASASLGDASFEISHHEGGFSQRTCKVIESRNELPAIIAGAPISEASLIPGVAISGAHDCHGYCSRTSAS